MVVGQAGKRQGKRGKERGKEAGSLQRDVAKDAAALVYLEEFTLGRWASLSVVGKELAKDVAAGQRW